MASRVSGRISGRIPDIRKDQIFSRMCTVVQQTLLHVLQENKHILLLRIKKNKKQAIGYQVLRVARGRLVESPAKAVPTHLYKQTELN